jgi:hypothetical protein
LTAVPAVIALSPGAICRFKKKLQAPLLMISGTLAKAAPAKMETVIYHARILKKLTSPPLSRLL